MSSEADDIIADWVDEILDPAQDELRLARNALRMQLSRLVRFEATAAGHELATRRRAAERRSIESLNADPMFRHFEGHAVAGPVEVSGVERDGVRRVRRTIESLREQLSVEIRSLVATNSRPDELAVEVSAQLGLNPGELRAGPRALELLLYVTLTHLDLALTRSEAGADATGQSVSHIGQDLLDMVFLDALATAEVVEHAMALAEDDGEPSAELLQEFLKQVASSAPERLMAFRRLRDSAVGQRRAREIFREWKAELAFLAPDGVVVDDPTGDALPAGWGTWTDWGAEVLFAEVARYLRSGDWKQAFPDPADVLAGTGAAPGTGLARGERRVALRAEELAVRAFPHEGWNPNDAEGA